MLVVFSADDLAPPRERIRIALIFPGYLPGPGQGAVDGRDLVIEDVRVGLVLVDPLLHDGLVVAVQRQTAGVVGARPLEAAGLDLEHIETPGVPFIDPFTDRVTPERRLDVVRPRPTVGVN